MNQSCIFPIGRLERKKVDLDDVKTYVDFKVIETLDYKNPYLELLGIEWAFDNDVNRNLKQWCIL